MESVPLHESKVDVVDSDQFMPHVYEVKMPCQWLENCYDGKCPALRRKSGYLYCAKKTSPR